MKLADLKRLFVPDFEYEACFLNGPQAGIWNRRRIIKGGTFYTSEILESGKLSYGNLTKNTITEENGVYTLSHTDQGFPIPYLQFRLLNSEISN